MIELNVSSRFLLVNFLFLLVFSFLITFLLIPILCEIAKRFKIIDAPDGKLKQQKNEVPYLGGFGIYCGFVASLILYYFLNSIFLIDLYFFFAITFLMLCGLVDDLINIKPITKLTCQFIASFLFLISLSNYGWNFHLIIWGLVAFWLTSIMNAFNLIDVMDGLAAICSLSVLFIFLLVALIKSDFNLASLILCLIGSIFGFFIYNKPPATIYMGDSGSLLLGGIIGYIAIYCNPKSFTIKGFMSFIVIMVPILELLGLIVIRMYKKLPVYLGSPDHFSIYLQRQNWTKSKILIFSMTFSCMFGLSSMFYMFSHISLQLLLITYAVLLILWIKTIYK